MLFRQLAEIHDWPPSVVRKLTYYQCRMLVCEEAEITGRVKVSAEYVEAWRRRGGRKAEKKFLRMFGSGR